MLKISMQTLESKRMKGGKGKLYITPRGVADNERGVPEGASDRGPLLVASTDLISKDKKDESVPLRFHHDFLVLAEPRVLRRLVLQFSYHMSRLASFSSVRQSLKTASFNLTKSQCSGS